MTPSAYEPHPRKTRNQMVKATKTTDNFVSAYSLMPKSRKSSQQSGKSLKLGTNNSRLVQVYSNQAIIPQQQKPTTKLKINKNFISKLANKQEAPNEVSFCDQPKPTGVKTVIDKQRFQEKMFTMKL
mmetsp:Transcript_1281/g.1549  ORF Transcript_1281/g.1549 Transcript_1281/m.1549 type:complete len:127 (+) Transcript_1281:982-1362(+)